MGIGDGRRGVQVADQADQALDGVSSQLDGWQAGFGDQHCAGFATDASFATGVQPQGRDQVVVAGRSAVAGVHEEELGAYLGLDGRVPALWVDPWVHQGQGIHLAIGGFGNLQAPGAARRGQPIALSAVVGRPLGMQRSASGHPRTTAGLHRGRLPHVGLDASAHASWCSSGHRV